MASSTSLLIYTIKPCASDSWVNSSHTPPGRMPLAAYVTAG